MGNSIKNITDPKALLNYIVQKWKEKVTNKKLPTNNF